LLKLKDISEIHGVPIKALGTLCKKLSIDIRAIGEFELVQICAALYELPVVKSKRSADPNIFVPVFGEDVFISKSQY